MIIDCPKIDIPNLNQISIGSNSLVHFNSWIISTTNDYEDLLNDQFRKRMLENLIFDENSLNTMNGDLILNGFDNLKKIIMKGNSLKNLNSLKISNCEELKIIEIEENSLSNVSNLIIESNCLYYS